jgi:hypothetical protein
MVFKFEYSLLKTENLRNVDCFLEFWLQLRVIEGVFLKDFTAM